MEKAEDVKNKKENKQATARAQKAAKKAAREAAKQAMVGLFDLMKWLLCHITNLADLIVRDF